jgi:exo-1,4-beta-D-glucosaminidase
VAGLNAPAQAGASLTVSAELANHTDRTVSGILQGEIESVKFGQAVTLKPYERQTVEFTPDEFLALKVENPRIWWPHDLGEPDLYGLHLKFIAGSKVCDIADVRFGIRQVQDYMNQWGHKGFQINGKKVLIRAAGWTDDLFLADTPDSIDAQLRYVKHMNLNSIRLEGIWGKDHTLYDLCDRYGILIMVGWSCQWEHEQYLGKPVDQRYGGVISPDDIELISKSWQDQVIWLRNHPSVYVWAVASDKVPKPELEKKYVETFRKYDPTRSYLSSAGGVGSEQKIVGPEPVVSEISGSSGVKMLGPYDYTPPVYWYTDRTRGGAYGFNTETSPGAIVPPLESIKKVIPQDHLWPIDEYWHFHCGLNEFNTLDRYQQAINRRYGRADSVEEFARKAQLLNYELTRPMFEAFRVNRPIATGVVHWMLNAAWPKMYWQLFDKYLMPTGAFYAARKACQSPHLLYNYADHSVYAVNDKILTYENMRAEVRVLDIYSNELLAQTVDIDVQQESSAKILALPEFPEISTTYFLALRLYDQKDAEVASNFYWLSTKPDVLDYDAKVEPWSYYTPSKEYADFTLLNSVPSAKVTIEHRFDEVGKEQQVIVKLQNISNYLAFFTELGVLGKSTGRTILPVFWEDNYISLLPGESRHLKATFPASDDKPVLTVNSTRIGTFNLPTLIV